MSSGLLPDHIGPLVDRLRSSEPEAVVEPVIAVAEPETAAVVEPVAVAAEPEKAEAPTPTVDQSAAPIEIANKENSEKTSQDDIDNLFG
jgi:hypothetical protein